MLNRKEAQDLARDFKIDVFTIYREYLQLLFLKYFYIQGGTDKVFFKGGTALRFLYNSFRFSEDLDFTSLQKERKLREIVEKSIKDIKKETPNISFQEGKTITDSYTGRIFQRLDYFDFPLTVRLDFSMRERPHRTEVSPIETQFPISPYPQVVHLTIDEILAEKIRAISIRVRGRDIFDLWFILSKKVKIDWSLVDKKMDLYEDQTVNLRSLVNKIEDVSQDEIENDLTKFLPNTQRNLVDKIKPLVLKKLRARM